MVRLATLYQGTITFDLCGQADTLPSGGQTLTIAGLGTGTFVSANGDILTADHVVNIGKSDLDAAIFQILATDIANLLNANASCLNLGGAVTPDQISINDSRCRHSLQHVLFGSTFVALAECYAILVQIPPEQPTQPIH